MEWDVEPSGAAQELLNNPLFNEILDALEHEAIEAARDASPKDDFMRGFHIQEANAIRSVRQQLTERASGKAKQVRTGPAA